MNNTLIIDANSWGFAAQSMTKLSSGSMEVQAAFGFIRTLRAQCNKYPTYTPLVLWDGKADWRFKLHPEYKSNRNSDPKKTAEREAYKKMRPYIARLLKHLGVRQLTASTHEADDMAGYFVKKLTAVPGSNIILSSGDRDWIQLVRENVAWDDARDDSRFVDAANFYDKTGCLTPFAFLETKVLEGDTSDVISGVGGIGAKGAPEFIAEFGSVRKFWQLCASGKHTPKVKAHLSLLQGTCPFTREEWEDQLDLVALAETATEKEVVKARTAHMNAWPGQGRTIYKRNLQLMQLLRVEPPARADIQVDPGKFDKEAFAAVCAELSFNSILKNVDEFTKRFEPKGTPA